MGCIGEDIPPSRKFLSLVLGAPLGLSSLETLPIFQTLNQSRIRRPQRNCRGRCGFWKTVAYALDFILDPLDYSRDKASVPAKEVNLRLQRCPILW